MKRKRGRPRKNQRLKDFQEIQDLQQTYYHSLAEKVVEEKAIRQEQQRLELIGKVARLENIIQNGLCWFHKWTDWVFEPSQTYMRFNARCERRCTRCGKEQSKWVQP